MADLDLSTAERLHNAVENHGIFWTDIAERVRKNTGLSPAAASGCVTLLIQRRATLASVAVAVVEMVAEKYAAEVELWRDRCEAANRDHDATIKHCDEMLRHG